MGRDNEVLVHQGLSPCLSLGSGEDFSVDRDEGVLVHLDPSTCVSLGSGVDFSVGLRVSGTVQQCSKMEGEDSFLIEAMKLKSSSCSMGNFAVKLVQRFFSQEQSLHCS